ncbi:hypothetical protein H7K45_12990 [Mycobacterium yunnanensis]|uniref:Uncharacterized protein n=1 Tax=Mycobacterium yunnanensis TaxID=368477 RepID=A0A9X3C2M8_9MYCO|nr:hypothetical protein [Mycobacterium yunnanensis]MCV7421461.1 hypothetical protein [Mycobacterium yunnanensis]
MAKLIVGALLGALLGALVGGLAFVGVDKNVTATALLRLQDPADLTAVAGGARQVTPDNQDGTTQFVKGEVAYLSGDGFARAVARKLAKDQPVHVKVIEENESAVVSVSFSGSSGDEAKRTVQAAVDLYAQQLEQRVDQEMRTILPRLALWESRSGPDPSRMRDIQRLRDSVQLQADMARDLLVMQPPTVGGPGVEPWVAGVVLGGLVGGSCAAVGLLIRWRRSGVGTLAGVIADNADGVLLPAVDLDMPARDEWSTEQTRLASTLHAICPSGSESRVILVVGTSGASGASAVSSLLALAVELSPDRPGTTTRIVDGGVIGDEGLTPDLVDTATTVVLVARLAFDDAANAERGLNIRGASREIPLMAVFTYRRRPWTRMFGTD